MNNQHWRYVPPLARHCGAVLALACATTAAASGIAPATAQDAAAHTTQAILRPAATVAHAAQANMLAAAWAGQRAVAVGAHGVILLSDDQGRTWRQAARVPVDATLTAVSFAGDREGWAVGHAGVVLHTRDGGEQWELQRSAPEQDRPLFSVHFFDRERGVAVGLWSLVLTTGDGGRSWTERQPDAPPGSRRADLNLYGLFTGPRAGAGPDGALYAAAEKGYVLKSEDQGHTWTYLATGQRGSLWAGAVLPDGVLLAGGLRGALLRSTDGGRHWSRIAGAGAASITSLVATGSGSDGVLAVGQDGLILRSIDGGATFQASHRQDRLPLNAALPMAGFTPPLMSARGPAQPEGRAR